MIENITLIADNEAANVDSINTRLEKANTNFNDLNSTKADLTYLDTKLTEQKNYIETSKNYTLTHTKLGTVHTLSDLPTGQGIYQCQFIATADYTEGNTFTGYTAKPTGEDTILPDKAFVKGDIVSVLVDTVNKKLGFDVGGTSGKKYSTIVIGTSQSGYTAKDVDYLCDGINDEVEINNAINSLSSLGGEIKLLNGIYNISRPIVISRSRVTISGSSNSTTLKKMGMDTVIEVYQSYFNINNLTIDGNKSSYPALHGIYVNNASHGIIENIFCTNCYRYGVSIGNNCEHNIITNNSIFNTGSNGTDAVGIIVFSNYNTVSNNICVGNDRGVLMANNKHNIITNNSIINSYEAGIMINNGSNCIVIGNYCLGNAIGIYLTSSNQNNVSNNTFIRGLGQSSDYTSSQYTIYLFSSSCNYNLISNNLIMGKNYVASGGTSNTFINNKYN